MDFTFSPTKPDSAYKEHTSGESGIGPLHVWVPACPLQPCKSRRRSGGFCGKMFCRDTSRPELPLENPPWNVRCKIRRKKKSAAESASKSATQTPKICGRIRRQICHSKLPIDTAGFWQLRGFASGGSCGAVRKNGQKLGFLSLPNP